MKLSNEILLALAYVSKISDPDLVRSRFIESMNSLDEGFKFEFVEHFPDEMPESHIYPITTLRSAFGYAILSKIPETGNHLFPIFRNAFQFLATIIENRVQSRALESRNKSLLEEIQIEKSLVHTLLNTLPVGVYISNKNGEILMGNAAADKIWAESGNRGLADADNYSAFISNTSETANPEDWGIARAIAEGATVVNQEIDIKFSNGREKTILHSAAPLYGEALKLIWLNACQ